MPWSHPITRSGLRYCHYSLFKAALRHDEAMWRCRIDLFCRASGDMRGGKWDIECDWSAANRERQDRPEYFPQQAGLICWLDQVKGLNGCCAAAILSALNTLNLAQALRQIVYLFRGRRIKLHKDAAAKHNLLNKCGPSLGRSKRLNCFIHLPWNLTFVLLIQLYYSWW